MEGGERKEEGSLPPNYVSLAQLQERWLLRKQEERKLKQKQEEVDKREREVRDQNEKNQDRCWRSKTAGGGFVRARGVIQDKGEEKEVVGGGPGNRGKRHGKGKGKFNGATAVEFKEKAEVLSGGMEVGAGDSGRAAIFSRKGVSGGEISGVEEIHNVFAVEILPRKGEIADVKRTGLKKKSKNSGSRKVNELKQSEVALDLEKEREDKNDRGITWREKGREGNGGRVLELKQSDVALDLVKEKKYENDRGMKGNERGKRRDREEQGGRNGDKVNELKQSEVALDLKKEKEGVENDCSVKWRGQGRGLDTGERRGINEYKANELMQSEVALYSAQEKVENDCGMKWGERRRWQDRVEKRGRNGAKVNELKQSEAALDLEKEKEVENDCGMKWREKRRGQDRGSKGAEVNELKLHDVALDLEKEKEVKNDWGMKWREREEGRDRGKNGGRVNDLKQREVALRLEEEEVGNNCGVKWGERGRNGGYPKRKINRLMEYRPVVLTDNEVGSKLENKAEDGISVVCREISGLNVGEKDGLRGRDNKVKEGGAKKECFTGDKVAVKIEKKVDHEVLARKRENLRRGCGANGNLRGGLRKGYRTKGNSGGGYEGRRRYTSPHISDSMNSIESAMVWVKKEDKLDA